MKLTNEQINRYSRQIVLKEVGGIGQERLLNSKITLVGVGGLGSPAAYYLAAAGIGNLKIVDFDTVEMSNLQRQILHFTSDIDKKKTASAVEKLHNLNPDCKIEIINERIVPNNVKEVLNGSSFVIEGSDNLPTKMLINDACVFLKIPFTIAGVLRFHGQIMTVNPQKKTTCYRCVFTGTSDDTMGLSCSEAGVLGLVPGVLGCLEANESIKFILGIGELIVNKMLFVDLLTTRFNLINIYRDENCLACGKNAEDLVKTQDYGGNRFCQ